MEVYVSPELLSLRDTSPNSSTTTKPSEFLVHMNSGRGMEKTVQVRVEAKVTLTVSSGGVTLTLGGSVHDKKRETNMLKTERNA